MLTEILMEALMNMDDESLDSVLKSCDAEELEIISDAMEATTEMTAKDKEDFNFINNIQRQASSKDGWASVDKKDRDKFVDIMTKTKNLKVLKKAAKLGEREATHDSRVKNALATIGATTAGGILGASFIAKNNYENDKEGLIKKHAAARNAIDYDAKYKVERMDSALSEIENGLYHRRGGINKGGVDVINLTPETKDYLRSIGYDRDYISQSTYDGLLTKLNKAKNALDAGDYALRGISPYITPPSAGGVMGGLTGAGVSAAIIAAKKGIKNARDLKALKAEGEGMTPNARWKANRHEIAKAEKFAKLREKSMK